MHFNILVYQLFWRYLQQFRRRSVGRRRFCAFWSSRSRVRVLVCRFGPLLLLAFALLLLRPATRLFVRRVFFEYTTYPADGVYTNRQSIPPELRATHRSVALGTPLFGGGDWPVSSNERPFVSCDEPRCVLQLETADADAVVYHSYDLFYFPWIFASLWLRSFWRPGPAPGAHGGDDEDETRSGRQRQKLVLYNLEPPTRWGRNAWLLNGIFDWVAFYRADSDIPLRYMFFKFVPINGSLQSAQTPKRGPGAVAAASLQVPRNYAAGRTRLAFIITSHCEVPSDRLAFIHSLQTSLVALQSNPKPKSSAERSHRSSASYSSATPEERLALARASRVDVLGGCGRTCARDSHDCDVATLARSYKFYLALENARCTDYITEKFWDRGLWHELVPIVNGGTGALRHLLLLLLLHRVGTARALAFAYGSSHCGAVSFVSLHCTVQSNATVRLGGSVSYTYEYE